MIRGISKTASDNHQNGKGIGMINLKAAIFTIFIALAVSYFLCILAGAMFGWVMYEAWIPLLPGFVWPVTPGGVLIGLAWIIGYGVYFGVLIVYPYNFLRKKLRA